MPAPRPPRELRPHAPDVVIAGRGYVRLRGSESGREILLPVDSELSVEAAEVRCRRSSEVMARQDERDARPEEVDCGARYGGQNAVEPFGTADQRAPPTTAGVTAATSRRLAAACAPARRASPRWPGTSTPGPASAAPSR